MCISHTRIGKLLKWWKENGNIKILCVIKWIKPKYWIMHDLESFVGGVTCTSVFLNLCNKT